MADICLPANGSNLIKRPYSISDRSVGRIQSFWELWKYASLFSISVVTPLCGRIYPWYFLLEIFHFSWRTHVYRLALQEPCLERKGIPCIMRHTTRTKLKSLFLPPFMPKMVEIGIICLDRIMESFSTIYIRAPLHGQYETVHWLRYVGLHTQNLNMKSNLNSKLLLRKAKSLKEIGQKNEKFWICESCNHYGYGLFKLARSVMSQWFRGRQLSHLFHHTKWLKIQLLKQLEDL